MTNTSGLTKKLLVFAAPLCAISLMGMVSNLIAILFVAQLGQVELAASALAYTSYLSIFTVCITTLYSVSILSSNYVGQGKFTDVGMILKNSFWLSLVLGVIGSLLFWKLPTVLLLFKHERELIAHTIGYFHYAALSMVPSMIGMAIGQFYIGIGRPRFTLIVTAIRLPLIVIFSYIHVLGRFGFSSMGLTGVSYAIFIVQCMVCVGVSIYLLLDKSIKKYQIFTTGLTIHWDRIVTMIKIGLPIGLQFGGELAAITVATYMMGVFGIVALAATQIVSQYAMLCVMITLGISQAISVLISEAYGKKDFELINGYKNAALKVLLIFFSIVLILFVLLPKILMLPYIHSHSADNAEMISLTKALFIVAGISMFIDAIRNLLSGALRGLHDSTKPMIIGILSLWVVAIPMSYLIGFTLNGGPIGLRLGFATGFVVGAIALWQSFANKTRGKYHE